jgi:TRAP transporter TAXI family solute receptor
LLLPARIGKLTILAGVRPAGKTLPPHQMAGRHREEPSMSTSSRAAPTLSRRAFAAGTALATGALASGLGGSAAWAQKSVITFGSTNATSSHYALAVAMSKAIKQELPNANVSMIETGASVDNVRRMTKGEIDFGLVMLDTMVQAETGSGPFKNRAVPDMAVLYAYDSVSLQMAVRVDSKVERIADLTDKKFSAGIHGSGAEVLTHQIFDVLGVKPRWVAGSVSDAVQGIQNRQLVGYSKYGVGAGLDATMRELLTSNPMKFVSLSGDEVKKLQGKVKGVAFEELPAGTIPGEPAATVPVVLATYSARTGTMDDATAYAIAKAIYENRQFLIEVFPHLKNFDFKAQSLKVESLGVKLHPGARKYWMSLA